MVRTPHNAAGPDEPQVRLEGRRLAAGAHGRDYVAHLLGLDNTGHKIEAVAWVDHAVEASLTLEGQEAIVFRIERRSKDSEGLITTDHLVVYYRGKDLPPDIVDALEKHAAQGLQSLRVEDLSAELALDPELGKPGLPMPPGIDDSQRPGSLLDSWGGSDVYADFFAGGELARAQLDSLDPGILFTFVQHSDCECLHVNPHGGGPVVWLINYPWDNRIRQGNTTFESLDLISAATEGMLTSDLTENDVIMGNPGKLQGLLDQAAKVHQRSGKTLFFSNTCTPVVTGEDVESQIKIFREKTGIPLLYLTVTPRSMVNVFHDVLVDKRLAAEEHNQDLASRSVNLIGFQSGPEVDELRKLLALTGTDVNCTLLPALSFELIERLPRAGLNVYKPNKLWQHLYDQLQFSSRIPHISPAAPYGQEATKLWLTEVQSHLGEPEGGESKLEEQYQSMVEGMELIRQKAQDLSLGFVVRSAETHFLTSPASTWGVPLIAMLEEMGFSLDVYIKVEDRETARRAALEVQACFEFPQKHIIKAFDSPELMRKRLSKSRAQAFFSTSFFDWRITSAGKNLFSLQHFEMGWRGGLRTAERLLGICQTPFYRKYARFLSRSSAGLRHPTRDEP